MLIVDDDDSLRRALARTVRLAGFEVEAFESVEALLAHGVPERDACLVLDVDLPGIGGIAFKRTLVEAGRDLPTIFITALEPAEVGRSLAVLPPATVLYKPFNKEDLLAGDRAGVRRGSHAVTHPVGSCSVVDSRQKRPCGRIALRRCRTGGRNDDHDRTTRGRGTAGRGHGAHPGRDRTASRRAQPAGIEPQAEKLLKASMAYLAGQKQFTADTRSTIEFVTTSGQKLQFDNAVTMAVQRPNKLWAARVGDLVDQVFYYDGKSLTLHNPGQKVYASVPAPGTLEEMLDFAREKLDIVAPAGDFVYKNAFEILMQDVKSAFVVGKGVVEGVRCDHLAFRAPHVDWQIWIQEGKQPLPRKIVITSTDITGAPQFAVVITKWNLAPKLADGKFTFTPPKGARSIEFLPVGAPGAVR